MNLLFIMHGCGQIELYERDEYAIHPRLVFEIRLGQDCITDVRQRRLEFMNQTLSTGGGSVGGQQWLDQPVVTVYPIIIETVRHLGGSEQQIASHRSVSWFKLLLGCGLCAFKYSSNIL